MSVKQKILRLLKKNYSVSKKLYTKQLEGYYDSEKPLVLIYTMGKVASTSVYKSIVHTAISLNVYHVHMLDWSYLNRREQMIRQSIFGKKQYSAHLYQDLLWKPMWVNEKIREKDEIKLITMVREPIGRNISLFFQWIDFTEDNDGYHFISRSKNYPFDIKTDKEDLSPMYDYFINHFTDDSHIEWLNNELGKVFTYNLLHLSFDRAKGYESYISEKNGLLVLKLEKLDDCFEEATTSFLGERIPLIKANEAKDKDIYKIYQRFRKEIQFPSEYIDRVYNSDYVRHFYSEPEIYNFKQRWNIKN